ncbi:hypothetical protein [Mesoflavibacter zeaxanthinifaciens]|uniref:hypothetical protein n=1 Tax=Mesoflavibacter zeaxanthinifaciens TaxID=393060 RepID=UPI000416325E|nr:hypothetical protein [Mesoflavibacter zeaxanthinifaciens]
MENILNWLNSFVRDNSLTSVLLVSLVLNIIYDLLKKLFFSIIKFSITKTNRWSLKNIEFLVNHYKDELKSLKKISENNNDELLNLIEETYNYFLFCLIIVISLLFINKVTSDLFFYSFLGTSTTLIMKIIGSIIYNYKLVKKSKKIEFHEKRIKRKIKTLKELIKKHE